MNKKDLKLKQLCEKIRQLCVVWFFNAARLGYADVLENIINTCEQILEEADKRHCFGEDAENLTANRFLDEEGEYACLADISKKTMVNNVINKKATGDGCDLVLNAERRVKTNEELSRTINQAYLSKHECFVSENAGWYLEDRASLLDWEEGRNPYTALQNFGSSRFVFCNGDLNATERLFQKLVEILENETSVADIKERAELLFCDYFGDGAVTDGKFQQQ